MDRLESKLESLGRLLKRSLLLFFGKAATIFFNGLLFPSFSAFSPLKQRSLWILIEVGLNPQKTLIVIYRETSTLMIIIMTV